MKFILKDLNKIKNISNIVTKEYPISLAYRFAGSIYGIVMFGQWQKFNN